MHTPLVDVGSFDLASDEAGPAWNNNKHKKLLSIFLFLVWIRFYCNDDDLLIAIYE